MDWDSFYDSIKKRHVWKLVKKNKSNDVARDCSAVKRIVLFGNCHMVTLGCMLHELTHGTYDVYIILSWTFEKEGQEKFDMVKVRERVHRTIGKAHVFLYQKHTKAYLLDADRITDFVNTQCCETILQLPNLKLQFHTSDAVTVLNSKIMLEYSIAKSDFPEFQFIVDNYPAIRFFRTEIHPTHYLLFLMAVSCCKRIQNKNKCKNQCLGSGSTTQIGHYFAESYRERFRQMNGKYVVLPGLEGGIDGETEFFDYDYDDRFNVAGDV